MIFQHNDSKHNTFFCTKCPACYPIEYQKCPSCSTEQDRFYNYQAKTNLDITQDMQKMRLLENLTR